METEGENKAVGVVTNDKLEESYSRLVAAESLMAEALMLLRSEIESLAFEIERRSEAGIFV